MRRMRKTLTLLLALAVLCGLAAVPAAAAEEYSFTDITDPLTAEAAEVLRIMGVVNGVGDSAFNPSGNLTRAEFCKMAILLTGRGGEVAAYENRTIFTDVAYNHWARGYVNLAAQATETQPALMLGMGNGTFAPDAVIPYQQAVTVLLRILGYGDDVQTNWPYSATGLASSLGLARDLGTVSGPGPITRAQAAILFVNTLTAVTKGSQSTYASTLGTPLAQSSILLSLDAETSDGGTGILFSEQETPVRAAHAAPAPFLLGRRGTALLDSQGLLLAFIPERSVSRKTVTVQSVGLTSVTGADGSTVTVPLSTPVWQEGKDSEIFADMSRQLNKPGTVLTLYFNASGAVDYIYVGGANDSASGPVMVAQKEGPGAFDAITGGSRTCKVVKNGAAVTQADLRKFDVGQYAAGTDTLYVTDFRLTGLLEDAGPNPYAPTSVDFYDKTLKVLDCAIPDFETVKPGQVVTVLFAPNGQVAGVKPTSAVSSNAWAVVDKESAGSTVTVRFLNSPLAPEEGQDLPALTGDLGSGDASDYVSHVVNVSGGVQQGSAVLYLSRQSGVGSGLFSVASRTVGNAALADNAVILEKVGSSPLTVISLADILVPSVPASQVVYTHRDSAGKVDILVLNDVTGDRYTYGLVDIKTVSYPSESFGEINNSATVITYPDLDEETDKITEKTVTVLGALGNAGKFGGVSAGAPDSHYSDVYRSNGYVTLTEVPGATSASFDAAAMTFTNGSTVIPVAPGVACYDESAGKWYSFADMMRYFTNFTVYYDRTPATGAKVRVIVAK